MTKAELIGRKLRKILVAEAKKLQGEKVVVFGSSGVDSQTVLFAALEAGLKPAISSFTLEDRESRDFRIAREMAETFELRFLPVYIPIDLKTVQRKIIENVTKYGCDSKIHIETFYPIRFAIDEMRKRKQTAIITGHGADTYYCVSRRANIEFKNREDDWRELAASSPNWNQRKILFDYTKRLGLKLSLPYQTDAVFKLFKGTKLAEISKPRQKEASRQSFPDYFEHTRVYNHQNYHHGDTGIASLFSILLDSDWNINEYKSVRGIYNAVMRGDIK